VATLEYDDRDTVTAKRLEDLRQIAAELKALRGATKGDVTEVVQRAGRHLGAGKDRFQSMVEQRGDTVLPSLAKDLRPARHRGLRRTAVGVSVVPDAEAIEEQGAVGRIHRRRLGRHR